MTHVKALQAGHSSQGTSEPIIPVTIPAWTKGQRCWWVCKDAPTLYYWTTTGTVTILISESDLCGSDDLPITCSVSKGDVWVSVSWIFAWPICIYGREAYLLGRLRPPPSCFLDADSELMEMCIVHDRCRDQCNTYGAASNPNGRGQNYQLWYENTVKWGDTYLDVSIAFCSEPNCTLTLKCTRGYCHAGTPFGRPLITWFTVFIF